MLTIFGLVCFLMAVGWLIFVIVWLRPRGAAWRNYAALRQYRRHGGVTYRDVWRDD